MRNWIYGILEFEEYKIKVKNHDHNGKILLDFNKINQLSRNKRLSKQHRLSSLQYDGSDKAFTETKSKNRE